MLRPALAAALGLALLAGPAFAQAPAGPPANPPPAVPVVISKDPTKAPAGTYTLDSRHAAVIGRVAHQGGFSIAVYRFDKVTGSLDWNPADAAKTKITINVDPNSINYNFTPAFLDELRGERFLNVAKFPTASFVSTKIEKTGPATAKVTGDLTFMGVTKPIVVDAQLIGAGNNARGTKVIGLSGKTTFTRADFGLTALANNIGATIELDLDFEFTMQ